MTWSGLSGCQCQNVNWGQPFTCVSRDIVWLWKVPRRDPRVYGNLRIVSIENSDDPFTDAEGNKEQSEREGERERKRGKRDRGVVHEIVHTHLLPCQRDTNFTHPFTNTVRAAQWSSQRLPLSSRSVPGDLFPPKTIESKSNHIPVIWAASTSRATHAPVTSISLSLISPCRHGQS